MPEAKDKRGIYDFQDASVIQRIMLAGAGALWVALVWWMLFGHGIETVSQGFGWNWHEGNVFRRICLAAALSIYYLRLLFTWSVFLKRGISRKEAFTVAVWLLCIYLFLSISGGRNADSSDVWLGLGVVVFIIGSWLNTWAEYATRMEEGGSSSWSALYAGTLSVHAASKLPRRCHLLFRTMSDYGSVDHGDSSVDDLRRLRIREHPLAR
jgi:hypothetical protein